MSDELIAVRVGLIGLTPLIHDRPDPNVVNGSIKLKGKPAEEQAQYAIYLDDEDRKPVQPLLALYKCLISAAVGQKAPAGKAGLARYLGLLSWETGGVSWDGLPAVRLLRGDGSPIETPEIFGAGVVRSRNRVIAYRVIYRDWLLRFEIGIPWTEFAGATQPAVLDSLRKLFEIGGIRVGLGNWRPERSGFYGKFAVEQWEPQ